MIRLFASLRRRRFQVHSTGLIRSRFSWLAGAKAHISRGWIGLLGWGVMMSPGQGLAAIHSLEDIRGRITTQLASMIQQESQDFDIEVAPLDPRLRLPECGRPLSVILLRGRPPVGAVSVGVRCRGKHPWTIYAKAHVRLFREVLILNRPLPKGAILDAGVTAMKRVDIASLRQGYFDSSDKVVGHILKRSLPAGSVLTPRLIDVAKVVHKGEAVTIRAQMGPLDVRMGGHALMDGELGQQIKVRNDRSQRIVEAVVAGPGDVKVHF